jgi:hypothetical protein
MVVFDHEKLEVYCVAVEYADAADSIAAKLKRGNAHIRDQLRRAADSIVNNIAEGAGEFQPAEKRGSIGSLCGPGQRVPRRYTPASGASSPTSRPSRKPASS